MKYILVIGLLVILYITEPLWRAHPPTNNTEMSQIDKEILEQKNERNDLIASEAEKLRKIEEKCGKKPFCAYKSRVPKPVQTYWDKTLKNPDSLHDEICTPLQSVEKGWMTSCQYKVRTANDTVELRLDTYIIKDGKVIR